MIVFGIINLIGPYNNELSFFYNFIHGNGYAMGSLGPIYFHNLKNHKYGFRLNNDNHFFRVTSNRQRGKSLNRITLLSGKFL